MAQNVKKAVQEALKLLGGLSTSELIERRFDRLMSYGRFKEQPIV
jgi:acetyl-CoA carboxylase carboxyl transferase subunit alpha